MSGVDRLTHLRFQRADAARNVGRILEVAAQLLGENPSAGLSEVATAAGLSRATIYRHFANRLDLIDAIRDETLKHGLLAVERCQEQETAVVALEKLTEAWLLLGQRYSFPQIAAQAQLGTPSESVTERRLAIRDGVQRLFERAQKEGALSGELSPAWAATAFSALIVSATREINEGSIEVGQARTLVLHTLLHGLMK